MRFGIEKQTITLDENNSTRTIINKKRNYDVAQSYIQYVIREKVSGKKEEMSQYIKFTESIARLLGNGKLVIKDEDPTLSPAFVIDYPRTNIDGSYFVIKKWTEIA